MRFPATAPIPFSISGQAEHQPCGRVSKTQLARGSTEAACQIANRTYVWGRGRQAMHLLCKQVDVGALPTDSTSLRSEATARQARTRLGAP